MVKRGKRRKGKKLNQENLQNAVLKILSRAPKKSYNAKLIAKKLGTQNSKDSVQTALDRLAENGKIKKQRHAKYKISRKIGKPQRPSRFMDELIGNVDLTKGGAAYITNLESLEDVYIPPKYIGSVLQGDVVKVRITSWNRRRPEGKIIEIIRRQGKQFIGKFIQTHHRAAVIVQSPKLTFEIKVKPQANIQNGERVVVEVTNFGKANKRSFKGQIIELLASQHPNDIEMHTILLNQGFEIKFPEAVLKESESIDSTIDESHLKDRRDFRGIPTFTIDPVDAKDFDDALSYQYLEDQDIHEVGVHIADVTHFVKPGSELDKEAYQRSTSVYLVDRVAPMLPEHLSNGLCSLRPGEDKFCFSAVFKFNQKYEIVDRWIGKTIIHSDQRFSYEDAQALLEGKPGQFRQELSVLNEIALALRKEKFENGAIAFESDELRFVLGQNSVPIGIQKKERKEAHLLIEDFMLLANRAVAEFIHRKSQGQEIPFVYRVHDLPDIEKLVELSRFASEFGLKFRVDTPNQIMESLNNLAKKAREDDRLKILEPIAIRTMAKAAYSTDNIGHYGLGFDFYTHFTSPIRRYSDVLVHRILYKNLKNTFRANKSKLEDQCIHVSSQERKAMSAERESIKYKQAEYIQNHLGESFEGLVTGFMERGIFIELKENKIEGLLNFQYLNEPFRLKNGKLKAEGKYSGDSLKIGDSIQVRVESVDLEKRQVEFDLAE